MSIDLDAGPVEADHVAGPRRGAAASAGLGYLVWRGHERQPAAEQLQEDFDIPEAVEEEEGEEETAFLAARIAATYPPGPAPRTTTS